MINLYSKNSAIPPTALEILTATEKKKKIVAKYLSRTEDLGHQLLDILDSKNKNGQPRPIYKTIKIFLNISYRAIILLNIQVLL